ncbi:MAG: PKD domain-containing protein [Euryarchaeota archaeon]|nr:PKD domain-containing protein [Euryarchaeota archaeon]MDE1879659.1 PKD domain-containing protein [Euryarchaeota archaeon]MDE2045185.1 PKD domain-containing protein [Thermoplasmata archaeon]
MQPVPSSAVRYSKPNGFTETTSFLWTGLLIFLLLLLLSPTGTGSGRSLAHAAAPSSELRATTAHDLVGSSSVRASCWVQPLSPVSCASQIPSSQIRSPTASSDGATSQVPLAGSFWRQICYTGNCGPGSRESPMVAYDPTDGYLVLFGGYNGTSGQVLGDTWTYTYPSGTWTQIFPTTSPPARYDGQLAWDPVDGYLVLFSGCGSSACPPGLTDTWKFIGGQWTQLTPTTSPAGRYFFGLSWDTADNYMLLFGGYGSSGYQGDTWKFLGGQWTQLAPAASPPARLDFGMSDDPTDSQVVLFGGYTSSGALGDTWTYSGGTWTQIFPSTPPPALTLQNHQMDTDTGYPLIWGGYDTATSSYVSTTWTYAAGQWTQQSPSTSPPAKGWGAMNYYGGVGTIDFGGYNPATGDVGDSWLYVSGFRASATATPDPTDVGGAVAFSGTASGGTPPYVYAWVYGDGGKSAYISPTHTYNSTGSFGAHFWTNETTGLLRSREANLSVVVNSLPTVAPTATPSTVDAKVGITFASGVAGGAPPYTVTWRFGNGASAVGDPISYPFPSPGSYTVHVWANDSSIGRATGAVAVTVNPALVYSSNVHPLALDVGSSAHYFSNVTSGTPPRSSAWTFGDGGRAATGNASHTYTAVGTYAAVLWANDSGGSAWSMWYNITVNPLPGVSIAATYPNVDVGVLDSFVETTSGGTAPWAYAWRFGDGGTAAASTATHTYTAVGAFVVSAWANDSSGNSAVSTLAVTVYPPLVAWANATKTTVDLGMVDGFIAAHRGGAPPVSITWSLGDGTWGSGSPISHTYTALGNYTVNAWVNDSGGGLWSGGGFTVTVSRDPRISANVSNPTTDVGNVETFSVVTWGGSTPYAYHWAFGDGTSSSLASPTHAFNVAGAYFAQIWANDSAGGSVSTLVPVVVHPALVAHASPATAWADVGGQLGFAGSARGGTAPYTFAWSFGDGSRATGAGAAHTYLSAGTYTGSLWVNDSAGGASSQTITVTVNPPLTVTLSASPTSLDVGATTSLGATVGGGNASTLTFSYSGLPGGCASSNANPLSCRPTVAGSFGVAVQVSDGLSTATSPPVVVTVGGPLAVSLSFTPSIITVGRTTVVAVAVLGGTGTLSFTYTGLPSGCSGPSGASSFTCRPAASGTAVVTVQATDGSGATGQASSPLMVNPAPSITAFTATPSTGNVGSAITFSVAAQGGTGALVYSYTGLPTGCSSENLATFSCTPTMANSYAVVATVTDSQGVSANSTTLSVVVAGAISPAVAANPLETFGLLLIAVVVVFLALALVVMFLGRRRRGSSPQTVAPPSSSPEAAPVAPAPPSSPSYSEAALPPEAAPAPVSATTSPPSSTTAAASPSSTCLICGRPMDGSGTCGSCGWQAPR